MPGGRATARFYTGAMETALSDQPAPPDRVGRRASYGLSLLVALGWYVTVIAAIVVGELSIPERPRPADGCSMPFACMSRAEGLQFMAVVLGVPILGGLLIVSLLMIALVARKVASPIVAGTVCAAASVAVVMAAIAAYGGLR